MRNCEKRAPSEGGAGGGGLAGDGGAGDAGGVGEGNGESAGKDAGDVGSWPAEGPAGADASADWPEVVGAGLSIPADFPSVASPCPAAEEPPPQADRPRCSDASIASATGRSCLVAGLRWDGQAAGKPARSTFDVMFFSLFLDWSASLGSGLGGLGDPGYGRSGAPDRWPPWASTCRGHDRSTVSAGALARVGSGQGSPGTGASGHGAVSRDAGASRTVGPAGSGTGAYRFFRMWLISRLKKG